MHVWVSGRVTRQRLQRAAVHCRASSPRGCIKGCRVTPHTSGSERARTSARTYAFPFFSPLNLKSLSPPQNSLQPYFLLHPRLFHFFTSFSHPLYFLTVVCNYFFLLFSLPVLFNLRLSPSCSSSCAPHKLKIFVLISSSPSSSSY